MTTYAYDAANRLATQNGQSTFTWDANGNLLQDGSTVYAYDFANRLISTTLGGTTTQFAYNGDGIRLRLIEAGTLTTYTQDYAAPLPVVLQAKTGSAATQYVYSLGTRPLAEYEAAAWEHLLPDPLGSVRQIADSSGNVTLLKSYEPYGSVLNSQGSATSIFAYAGEQVDNTGLIYLRARYMQPRLGVFLSRDSWGGSNDKPLTHHGFLYADGNPVNLTDESGMCTGLCRPNQLAYVANTGGAGLALRVLAGRNSNVIRRLPDKTSVLVTVGGPLVHDEAVWQRIIVGGTIGWAAEWDLRGGRTEYLTENRPQSQPPGGDSPSLNFGFTFYGWPVQSPKYYQPFGPNLFAYCTAALQGLSDEEKLSRGCPSDYLSFPNYYSGLHGLHNGVDFGAPDGTAVMWTANVIGTVVSNPALAGDAAPNVVIEVGNYHVIFGHVRAADICLTPGSTIQSGETIGWTTGGQNHLHLGIVHKDNPYYYLNSASAFTPNSDTLGAEYAPGYGPIKGFNAIGSGSYWDGTFTDYAP